MNERQKLLNEISKIAGDINRYHLQQHQQQQQPIRQCKAKVKSRISKRPKAFINKKLDNSKSKRINAECTEYNQKGKCVTVNCLKQHHPGKCHYEVSLPDLLYYQSTGISPDLTMAAVKCKFSHLLDPMRLPLCSKFLSGTCTKQSLFQLDKQTNQLLPTLAKDLFGLMKEWAVNQETIREQYCLFLHIFKPRHAEGGISDSFICTRFALNQYCPLGPIQCTYQHSFSCIYWDPIEKICKKKQEGLQCSLYHPAEKKKKIEKLESHAEDEYFIPLIASDTEDK